uniref:Uncharacterized protein n=1 Tax=Brassica oleracea var. oleracea TaxID=109376 RepID=A0A0D3BGC9_BRAOL
MDFRNWDPGNRWGSGDYDRIGHLYSSGIKGIRKIHGDAKGKDQLLDLVEGFTTEEPYIKGSVWPIGIWTVINVGTLVRFDWDFDRGNVVGSFNFRRFGFTEVLDLGSSDQYKWSLGQLIGNSGDMKSGEGILIFMDQDLLVVRSSQQVMASGFYAGSVVWIILEMLWYLGSEFKIGVLWLVEDSVMVCEIWLWWKSVYVFVNSNEKWKCLGFEFHSGESQVIRPRDKRIMAQLGEAMVKLGQLGESQWELSQCASAGGAGRTSSLSWGQLAISSTQLG